MIETKEDYQQLNGMLADTIDEADHSALLETIEALREVVKAAEFAKYMAAAGFDTALNNELDKLRVVLEALPDWITDG